jgi:uncharacterized repeat protein (TIGR01451 family)
VAPGGQATYTLVVSNNGPSDATGVTVNDAAPTGLSGVSAQPAQGSCTVTGDQLSCAAGNLAAGGSTQVLVTATVAPSFSGPLSNTATVIADQPDPSAADNTSTTTIAVPAPPVPPQPVSDLRIVKHVNHGSAYPGQALTYTLTVTNTGPDTAANASVIDTSSLGLKVLSARPSQGSCHTGRPITCALGTITATGHATITVRATVTRAGAEKNSATAASASRDPNLANNLSSASTTLTPILRLSKTASPRRVSAGSDVTYHLTVTNPNTVSVRNITVCDSLPLGLAYVSSGPSARPTNGSPCWAIKGLGAGRSMTITLVALALTGAGGDLTNRVTATAQGAKRASAQSTVHIDPAPPPATPVTG